MTTKNENELEPAKGSLSYELSASEISDAVKEFAKKMDIDNPETIKLSPTEVTAGCGYIRFYDFGNNNIPKEFMTSYSGNCHIAFVNDGDIFDFRNYSKKDYIIQLSGDNDPDTGVNLEEKCVIITGVRPGDAWVVTRIKFKYLIF